MEKQFCIKWNFQLKFRFFFWKYNVGGFLNCCVEMWLYVQTYRHIIAYLHLPLMTFSGQVV